MFSPTPADAKALASADVFFVNGLGFEGWIERLEKSSGFKGQTVVASTGVKPLTMSEEEDHHHGDHAATEHDGEGGADSDDGHDHDAHAKGGAPDGEVTDPHAWQDLANGKIYVANIRDALIAADPAGKLGTQALTLSLLREGTTSKSSTQIAEAAERLGATLGQGASADRTFLLVSSPSPNLGGALDLFADVVRNPAFAPAEVERLRASLLTSIAAEMVDPGGLANRTMPTLLYGEGHPYAKLAAGAGDPAAVSAVGSGASWRSTSVAVARASFRDAVTRSAEALGSCSAWARRSAATSSGSASAPATITTSLGPISPSIATAPATRRFAAVTQALPGPAMASTRRTEPQPKANAATACAPPIPQISSTPRRARV